MTCYRNHRKLFFKKQNETLKFVTLLGITYYTERKEKEKKWIFPKWKPPKSRKVHVRRHHKVHFFPVSVRHSMLQMWSRSWTRNRLVRLGKQLGKTYGCSCWRDKERKIKESVVKRSDFSETGFKGISIRESWSKFFLRENWTKSQYKDYKTPDMIVIFSEILQNIHEIAYTTIIRKLSSKMMNTF